MQSRHFGLEYYAARLEQNRMLAEAASDPNIRAIHQRYAQMYEMLLSASHEPALATAYMQ